MDQVRFTIDPDLVVRFARGQVVAGTWRRGLSMLMDDIDGMTLDAAVDVLSGRQTLMADGDGFDLVSQNADSLEFIKYRHDVAFQTAGIFERDGEFFQPYARVRFGKADEGWALEELTRYPDETMSPLQFFEKRARYYARNRISDLVTLGPDGEAVLLGRVRDPAFWVKTFDDASEALAAFKAIRPLEDAYNETLQFTAGFDARHWLFYEKAMSTGQLLPDSLMTSPLGREDRKALATLSGLMDAVLLARASEESSPGSYAGPTLWEAEQAYTQAVLRFRIVEQAEDSGGFLEFTVSDEGEHRTVRVPRAPFLHWAVRDIKSLPRESLPKWETVSPFGLKMAYDNPVHTDWWLGAGLPLDDVYKANVVNEAAWAFCSRLAYEAGHSCVNLAGKGKVFGQVVFPKPNEPVTPGSIAVVPFAGVDYEMAMLTACKYGGGAVIAAVGGKLAHLATVGRETGARLVVVDGAMTGFREGEFVTVDADNAQVIRHGMLAKDPV
jgi:phosphohistidine swiveling domain-containing protein